MTYDQELSYGQCWDCFGLANAKVTTVDIFRKVVFLDGFLDFSLHWYVGLS